jgi:hypothetical protein
MLGGLTPEEDAIIDRAISETYALKDITGEHDFTGALSRRSSPTSSGARRHGGERILGGAALEVHARHLGRIPQSADNIDINQQFVVFSVRDMEDELKPVAMYIITHYIWNAIRHELKKRLLVIDEAWWMMKSEDTASFLYSLAKRGRKYYLGVAPSRKTSKTSCEALWQAYSDELLATAAPQAIANDHRPPAARPSTSPTKRNISCSRQEWGRGSSSRG